MAALILMLLACGSGETRPARARSERWLPSNDALAVPANASADLRRAISTLADVVRAAPSAAPTDSRQYSAWVRRILGPWMREVNTALEEAARISVDLAHDHELALAFAHRGATAAFIVAYLGRLQMPQGVEPTLEEWLRRSVAGAARIWLEMAEEAFALCADGAAVLGVAADCRRRANELPEAPRAEPDDPQAGQWPAVCEGPRGGGRQLALPSDPSATRRLAIVRTDSRLWSDREWSEIVAAVEQRVAAVLPEPLVPQTEIAEARRLATQGRLRADGPICGQAPALERVLAGSYPNLLVGYVSASCEAEGTARTCSLHLWFGDASGLPRNDLPPSMRALVEGTDLDVTRFVAAARHLERYVDPWARVGIGVAPPRDGEQFAWLSVETHGPWTAHADAYDPIAGTREAVTACHGGRLPLELDVDVWLDIAPDGSVRDVRPSDELGTERGRCIADAVRGARFPPTRTRQPRRIAAYGRFVPESREPGPEIRIALHRPMPALLRVPGTLHHRTVREAMRACQPGAGVWPWLVEITIDASGTPTTVDARPLVFDRVIDAPTRRCMVEALTATRWPCPPAGSTAEIEATLCIER